MPLAVRPRVRAKPQGSTEANQRQLEKLRSSCALLFKVTNKLCTSKSFWMARPRFSVRVSFAPPLRSSMAGSVVRIFKLLGAHHDPHRGTGSLACPSLRVCIAPSPRSLAFGESRLSSGA
jgi:hypothetical protein